MIICFWNGYILKIIVWSLLTSFYSIHKLYVCGVMVGVLVCRVVVREFHFPSGQTNVYKNSIWCFSCNATLLSQRIRGNTSSLGVSLACASYPTCLDVNCCDRELELYKSNSACCSNTSSSSHENLTCSRHDISVKFMKIDIQSRVW